MPHNSSVMLNSASTRAPAQSSNTREQRSLAHNMLRRSLITTRAVMAKLLPYYFMYSLAIRYIEEQKSSTRRELDFPPYPWWEEPQCILDADSFISDIEESVKDQPETDGWLLERGEQDSLLDPHEHDDVVVAQRFISAVEDWLHREVKYPDEVSLVDGDMDP
ncbi:hypothetical protein N7537_011403 [Penicillium hordei]|uniref:Uncharacterized protein n=1 Tax=Penicillium hordei TaxID=40994 RepID=A0AAD6DLP8_9EURO|nr:uncharacterized protein N7537_011403 [Penicillium hordei]KAJ5588725.1 hypothetical protein N7537_011403 [Penicillium hordei]